jgi:DNA-binding NarL/FixJ family response regulator
LSIMVLVRWFFVTMKRMLIGLAGDAVDEARPITVLIVDDHALLREGVSGILETQDDISVVGEASDSTTTIALAANKQPNVVLLDIEIPGGEAPGTVRQILKCSPRTRVIVLSMYESPHLVDALLTAGICGYLLKSIHWEELVAAIRTVAADSNRVVLGVSRESLLLLQHRPAEDTLSGREREVLALVGDALSNREIAARLSLTEATIKRHLRNIFVKLGAVSRIDAVNKAAQLQSAAEHPATRASGLYTTSGRAIMPTTRRRSSDRSLPFP